MRLSLCMIVKNEETMLGRCLESVKNIVNEMIIVDTGSEDKTIQIAKDYGAKVFEFEWVDDFSKARNFSISKATGDWILIMDADDELNPKDQQRVLELLEDKNIEIYLFETLSYVGYLKDQDTVSNLNIRLIKNHVGYHYEGAIHEQVKKVNGEMDKTKIKVTDIGIFHYGYLKHVTKEKKKVKRNMKILSKILQEQPQSNIQIFNLANEYLRMKNYSKAYELYKKLYKDLDPKVSYTPKLLVRMIVLLKEINKKNQALEIIEKGLLYYPQFTDLEYLRGSIYCQQRKYTMAIRSFKRCLRIGNAPITLRVMNHVGGYKASLNLGNIYKHLEDFKEAYKHYMQSFQQNPACIDALYEMASILFLENEDIHKIDCILRKIFSTAEPLLRYGILGNIYFYNSCYPLALKYYLKARKVKKNQMNIDYNIGMSYLLMKDYKKANEYFKKIYHSSLDDEAIQKRILCNVLQNRMDESKRLIKRLKTTEQVVYHAWMKILYKEKNVVIKEDSNESINPIQKIFELLTIMLKAQEVEKFEQSLELLNTVNDKDVLLKLGKLYYEQGHYTLAYKEMIRSIQMFNEIDEEGIEILMKVYPKIAHKNKIE